MKQRQKPMPSPTKKPENTLSPQAKRALAEAQERRRLAGDQERDCPKETDGPRGPDPARYGDWERKGIASDF